MAGAADNTAAIRACNAGAVGACIWLGRTWHAGSGAVCDGGTGTGIGIGRHAAFDAHAADVGTHDSAVASNYSGVANTGALTCAGDAGLATG